MNITIIGAGNSGLAMAGHLALAGETVTLWNRTQSHIQPLIDHPVIIASGVVEGEASLDFVTSDLEAAVEGADIIFVTTPAFSHKQLALQLAQVLQHEPTILLNPGRTFGALEFRHQLQKAAPTLNPLIAETQTIVYTCRKTSPSNVNIFALKKDVLLSTIDGRGNEELIASLPTCLKSIFIPASSMIETSIGNVGMILHCAPILLNTGWIESREDDFYYYKDGISPSVAKFLTKMDEERQAVARKMGSPVESTKAWMERTYHLEGDTLYDVIQQNTAYNPIQAPTTLSHRYVTEDIPMGLVPLEAVGKEFGLQMKNTGIIIDLASALMETDFRMIGRNLHEVIDQKGIQASQFLPIQKGD